MPQSNQPSDIDVETEDQGEGSETQNQLAELEGKFTSLLSDPDIQKVLLAKQQGKKLSIQYGEEAKNGQAKPEVEDSEDEETEKEEEEVSSEVKAVLAALDKRLSPFDNRVKNLEGLAEQIQVQEVQAQIAQVRERHKDFDKYSKQVLELSKKVQGVGVEDLLILAKFRAGDIKPVEESAFSERPGPTIRREKTVRKAESPRGRRAFSDVLQKALEKTVH